MNPIVIDSSVFVKAVLYSEVGPLERVVLSYDAFVPTNVLEETLFKIIIGVVGEEIKNENFFQIKKAWTKNIGKKEVENRFNAILEIFNRDLLKALEINLEVFKASYLISKEYGLLPNDGLIAATCKHYGDR